MEANVLLLIKGGNHLAKVISLDLGHITNQWTNQKT